MRSLAVKVSFFPDVIHGIPGSRATPNECLETGPGVGSSKIHGAKGGVVYVK